MLDLAGWPDIVEATPVPMLPDERQVHVHQLLETARGNIELRLSDVLATRGDGTSVFLRRGEEFELSLRLPTREQDTGAFVPVVSRQEHGTATTTRIEWEPPTVVDMIRSNVRAFISCARGERRVADTALTTAAQGVQLTRVLALVALAHERGVRTTIGELR